MESQLNTHYLLSACHIGFGAFGTPAKALSHASDGSRGVELFELCLQGSLPCYDSDTGAEA